MPPPTNVDRHRQAVAAYNAGDLDALIAIFDPRVELHSVFAVALGAVYHGHEGVRRWHRDLEESWTETRLEPEAYFDLGETTLAFHVYHGRGRESDAAVSMPIAQVAAWRDGRAVLLRTYRDREEALRDLGVHEAGLRAIDPLP